MKKSIKPIVVILAIMLVCGGLLAVLSQLLNVSNEERIQRAINKIYASEQTLPSLSLEEDVTAVDMSDIDYGEIKACYKLDNGDLMILSKGKKGYANGSVTVYVTIKDNKVYKVVQDSYAGQTLMSKLTDDFYGKFTDSANKEQASEVKAVSGATYSSGAVKNAVQTALEFASRLQTKGE